MKLFIAVLVLVAGAFAHEPLSKELIDYINHLPGNTWKAGNNEHWNRFTMDGIKKLMGVKKNPNPPEFVLERQLKPGMELPENFDSRTQWPKCTSTGEVRDQAACGSCWAFGAVEAMTDRICIASDGKSKPHISAEDMNDCCSSCGDGCGGGFPNMAWAYYVDTGLVTGGNYNTNEGCMPYSIPNCDHHVTGKYKPCGSEVPTPACNKKCESGYGKTFDQDKWFGSKHYHVSGVENIMQEIYEHGPVEADFTVYADFLSYKSGVYQHKTGSALGGHAVKIIGWGVESGTKYWLVTNSWNEDWGDKGFFKIIRGTNDCGFEEDIQAGLPK